MSAANLEGAEAAAQYFLSLVPYIYATGDLTSWLEMSDEECSYCRSIADDAEQLAANGGFVDGLTADITIEASRAVPEASEAFVIEVSVRESRSLRYPAPGVDPIEQAGDRYDLTVVTYHDSENWVVAGVEVN